MPCPTEPRRTRVAAVVSSILAASAAHAAATGAANGADADNGTLGEIIVTAQKSAENIQDVPISIQALDTAHLEQLQITSFDGYAKYLPSLSVQSYGPGQAQLYVRGVTNGGDGLHIGSQPMVGVYVDEIPVATIGNNLDVHVYDIERIEALSGPQGTLFGASAMAGVLRIITNKPTTDRFEAGYDLTANTYTDGAPGGKVEGFVNIPLADHVAVRLVGYSEHDGGYINNVPGPPETYPTSGFARTNAGLTKNNFNDIQTNGGRAAFKFDFADNWTVTPTFMGQNQTANGEFAYAPALGFLNVAQYHQDWNTDAFFQTMLTVTGKISDFDFVYAGGLLQRNVHSEADYSDYAYFYDTYYHRHYASAPNYFGDNFRNNQGQLINPTQYEIATDNYKKQSQEIRLSTPKDWRLHGVVGAFLQRQYDYTRDEYHVDGLADIYSVTNLPGVWYLDSQRRTDRDKAVFTDLNYDLTDKLTLTGGLREFAFDNTVYGFFGFNGQPTYDGYVHSSGEQTCTPGSATTNPIWPCVNIDQRATKSGSTHRLNLTYKVDPDAMLYTTWSTGFRPGGVNRLHTFPAYNPDYLTNFEAGWKTEWFGHRVRWNGAVFDEEWKDAQFGITATNGITEIVNAGRARVQGVESDVEWRVTTGLTLSASATALNAKMLTNACQYPSPTLTCTEPFNGSPNQVLAPTGSRLPVSAKFKGNLIARYEFEALGYDAHLQAALVGQTDVVPQLQQSYDQIIGDQPGYAAVDLAAGIKHDKWSAELYLQNAFDNRGESIRYTECNPSVCTLTYVLPIAPRLLGVTFGQKF
jgi:outer membrane receptor protein involved in Fe transport